MLFLTYRHKDNAFLLFLLNTESNTHSQEVLCFDIQNMISFIQQHFSEKITLDQIALAGGIGQSKCCKLFGTYIHQTPNVYLTTYRLNKSTELLRMSDLNITEIAYEVGFNGASYYVEAFRKYIGISPSEYRQNLKNVLLISSDFECNCL